MLVDTCLVRSAQRPSVAPPGSSDPEPRLPCPPADPPFTLRPGTCFSLKWLQERNEETPSQERPAAELRGVSILQGQTSLHLGVWVIVDTSGYETPPGGDAPQQHGPSLTPRPPLPTQPVPGGWRRLPVQPQRRCRRVGVRRTAGAGGRVRDGAGLTRALQLMQGEARGGGPTTAEVRQGEVAVCVRAARPAPGPRPAGEEKARQGPAPGRSLGACRPAGGSTPRHDPQRSAVPAVGMGAAGWAGLSQGPQGVQAVRSRRAGRSPRSPCPAAPAAGPAAGGRPSACGGSPATAPASRRRAWGAGGCGGGFCSVGDGARPEGCSWGSPGYTDLFSGSRSQQRTVMGKKLGGQFGGQ